MGARFPHRFIEAAPVPPEGIVGTVSIAEAFAGSYQDLMRRIEGAIARLRVQVGAPEAGAYIRALYPEAAIVSVYSKGEPETLWSYPYEVVGDTGVKLGEPVQVVETFRPISAKVKEAAGTLQTMVEAASEDSAAPLRFRCVVIQGGLSKNGNLYPDTALKSLVKLVEGAPVYHKPDALHLQGGGKDVDRLIGQITGATFIEGAAGKPARVEGVLELIDPTHAISVKVREAVARGMQGLFGLSIDAEAQATSRKAGGRTVRVAEAFTKVHSVDLIVEPGAGGRVISFIEAANPEGDVTVSQILDILRRTRPDLVAGKDATNTTEAEATRLMEAAMKPADPPPSDKDGDILKAVRMVEARISAENRINSCKLPALAKQKLIARFKEATEPFDTKAVDDAIKAEADYLGSFVESGMVTGLGDFGSIEVIKDRHDKMRDMFAAFFDEKHKDHRHAQSFKECYIEYTGDKRVTGQFENSVRLTEAYNSTSLSTVLSEAIHSRMIAVYRVAPEATSWRLLTGTPATATDFRSMNITTLGGYGDLPDVGEGAPYLEMDSPGDTGADYKVTKRGGTESITIEAIKNDNVGMIRRIPVALGRSAVLTLSRFVFNGLLNNNPNLSDGNPLFHADYGNLGSAAFSKEAYAAARLIMYKQSAFGHTDPISRNPKYLLGPADLEEAFNDAFVQGTENEKKFISSLKPDIIPVWCWTDANDWMLAMDPMDLPGIEIAFLDGQEEPEIFVQDALTVGSMFSNDKLTWKIRHIYGGRAYERRAFRKHLVT